MAPGRAKPGQREAKRMGRGVDAFLPVSCCLRAVYTLLDWTVFLRIEKQRRRAAEKKSPSVDTVLASAFVYAPIIHV